MSDQTHQGTGRAQIATLGESLPEAAFAPHPQIELTILGFRFTPDMLPGWSLGRARVVDTPRGVRLAQANATGTASGQMVRLEVMEAPAGEPVRSLFLEVLARFQIDPRAGIQVPPPVGEAMAALNGRALVFLRGNLVIAASSLGPEPAPLLALAGDLDAALMAEPETGPIAAVEAGPVATGIAARLSAPPRTGIGAAPMIKILHHRGRPSAPRRCFLIEPDGSAQQVPDDAVPGVTEP